MKTFICKNCGARFTGADVASKNGDEDFKCPKCEAKNAEIFEEIGIKKREWKPLKDFIKDNKS
jgi:DNA-directed RNA polymerase subunit RPC12/RpoP